MFCKNCGTKIEEGYKFCMNCGTPVSEDINSNGNYTSTSNIESQSQNCYKKTTASTNDTIKDIKEKIGKYSAGNDNILSVEEEEILCEAKWSIIALLIPFILAFFFLIIFSARSYGYYVNESIIVFKVFVWIIYFIVLAISVCLFLFRRKLVITNKKIYGRIGLIGIKQYSIPLDKINYLSVRYNIIDRLIGSANLVVCSGASLFPISFFFVRNAREIRTLLEKQIEEHK